MTATRHKLTLGEENTILRRQALCGCGCGARIHGQKTIKEHVGQLALGGVDEIENIGIWLAECSERKSNGPGGEKRITTAGSDAHARAKVRRLTGKNKAKRKKPIPSRPFPKQENAWPTRFPKT